MKIATALFDLLRAAAEKWNADRAPRLAAALAYYATFSLAPLIIVTIWMASLLFGDINAQSYLLAQIKQVFGADSADFVHSMIVARQSPNSTLLGFITLAGLFFGATGLFFGMQDALNTVWRVPPAPPRSIWRALLGILTDRALSFVMVLASGGLLIVALALGTLLTILDPLISVLQPRSATLLTIVNLLISFGVTALLFAMLYRILPETRVRWREVWLGSLSAALLFTIGRFVLSVYLTYSNVRTIFGAASSLVAVLIWVYYSAQIFLYGAEISYIDAQRHRPPS